MNPLRRSKTLRGSHGALRAPWLRVAVILAGLLLAPVSAIALAHAAFVRSEPAPNAILDNPPASVTIWFAEPVEPKISEITVLDSAGQSVTTEAATVLPADHTALTLPLPSLSKGVYTVAWKNFSAIDGHSLSGSFVFSFGVQPPTSPLRPAIPSPPPPSPIEVGLRWLSLLSILALAGHYVFELLISKPILAGLDDRIAGERIDRRLESRTLTATWVYAAVFLAISVGELLVRSAAASNLPLLQAFGRPLFTVLGTGWGNAWFWRTITFLGVVIDLAVASWDRSQGRLSGRREWQVVALAFTIVAIFRISLVSHGAALTAIRVPAIFSDYLHLLAASVWVGGILYMTFVIPPVMKAERLRIERRVSHRSARRDGPFCPENHIEAIGRFSALAMLSVGVLVVTGLYNSWAQVNTFPALSTPYGKTLLIKLGLIVPWLLLGAVNLLWVRPRLAGEGKALRLLRKIVAAEAILAVLTLLSVGVLVNLEPGRLAAPRQQLRQRNQLVLQSVAERVHVKAVIEPASLGQNFVVVYLTDDSGKAITNASAVTLRLTYLDQQIEPTTEDTLDHGNGIWVAHQANFRLAGNWQANLTIKRPGSFDARMSFKFKMPYSAAVASITLPAETGKRLWGGELVLLGLIFGGVGFYTGGRKTRFSLAVLMCGGVAIIAGIIIFLMAAG